MGKAFEDTLTWALRNLTKRDVLGRINFGVGAEHEPPEDAMALQATLVVPAIPPPVVDPGLRDPTKEDR